MRCIMALLLISGASGIQAQRLPAHAIGIAVGPSFYQRPTVTASEGGTNARFDLNGWSGALSYRRWLSAKWYAVGSFRTDINTIGFVWNGDMQPMGHWAGPNDASIGLPPHQFYFSAARIDLGMSLLQRGRWGMRGEAGIEVLAMPSISMGYSQTATVDGVEVPNALSYRIITDYEARLYQRLRVGVASVYTGPRLNEWAFSVAGLLGLQPDMLTGRYAVVTSTGTERGTLTSGLSGVEISIARWFTWGQPKLPRWAEKVSAP